MNIQNVRFMLVCRCWSHIQDFQDLIRRISRSFRHASFPICSFLDILRFPEIICSNTVWGFSWTILNNLGGPSVKNNGLLGSWTFALGRKIIKMNTCWVWKVQVNVTSSQWILIFLRSFWATLFLKFEEQTDWQTPSDPRLIACFPNCYPISYKNPMWLGGWDGYSFEVGLSVIHGFSRFS